MENWKTHKDCRLHLWKVLLWQRWSEPTLSSGAAITLGACNEVGAATSQTRGHKGVGEQEPKCTETQAVGGRVPRTVMVAVQALDRGWAFLSKCMATHLPKVQSTRMSACSQGLSAWLWQGEESEPLRDRQTFSWHKTVRENLLIKYGKT